MWDELGLGRHDLADDLCPGGSLLLSVCFAVSPDSIAPLRKIRPRPVLPHSYSLPNIGPPSKF